MNLRDEISRQVDKLSPDLQEEVLRFAASLAETQLTGEPGIELVQFASSLDAESAREMLAAIEEGCEHVDASEW